MQFILVRADTLGEKNFFGNEILHRSLLLNGMWCLRDVDQTPMKIMAVIYTKFSRMQKKMMGTPGPVYLA